MCPAQFRRMIIIGCLIVSTVTSSASGWAQPARVTANHAAPAKGETSGLAAAFGWGYQTPALGGQILYYFRLGERPISVVPYGGGAIWVDSELSSPKSYGEQFGLAAGCMGQYGRTHRLVADLSFGLARMEYRTFLLTREREKNSLYGATFALGYEFMAGEGFFVRTMVGATVLVEEPEFLDYDRVGLTSHLGLGYKFF
jgi:hypothetical protein